MIKNNFNFLAVMFFSSLIVGSYQLPLVENTLNKYGYENNINETFTYAKDFQQIIENQKISFSSMLNQEDNEDISTTVASINQLPVNDSVNMYKSTSTSNSSLTHTDSNLSTATHPNNGATPPLTQQNVACKNNCTILMIGDSVMGDVDFSLQRLIKKDFPKWKVIDGHKVSSGLTNQTYYDWPSTAKKLVEKYKPDYVFVLLGTNDAQGMMFNGKALPFNKEQWVAQYAQRVNTIKEIMTNNNSHWYWIGLPVIRDKGFNNRLQVIRNIQSENTKEHYISVESIFGKNDHSEPINMKLRNPDGIHLNSSGADLVAKNLINKLKE